MAKQILLLVGTVLLIQCVIGVPLGHGARGPRAAQAARAHSIEEIEDTPRNRLFTYAAEEFSEITAHFVDETKIMFQKVIREETGLANKNLESHFDKLKEFNEKAGKLKGITEEDKRLEETFTLFEKATDLLQTYDTDSAKSATPDIVLMEQLLEKHGSEELSIEFLRRFLNFIPTLNRKVQDYISSLTPTERENEQKLIGWYAKLKNQKTLDKKMEVFAEFFEIFED